MWQGSLESQESDGDRGLNMRDRCFSLNCIVILIISPAVEILFSPGWLHISGRAADQIQKCIQSHQQS